ncbi:MAG: hypothetical protein IKJ90_02135 [Bacteroidaceae bacterium]|nr:hypothetical protein [Bacteroidaceae bacterium]
MSKLKRILQILLYMHKTIYFNFRYLPFKQAVKLPIWLYKPKMIKCKGQIVIDSDEIHTGMIQLGFNRAHAYPHSGIYWENNGGTVIFKGIASIGNNSFVCVGPNAKVTFGNSFNATSSFKLISWYNVNFDYNVRFGWENMVLDTSFHRLKNLEGEFINKGYGSINIAHDTWIATRCTILGGTNVLPYTVVATNSLLQKKFDKSHILLGGTPAKIIKEGVWRDLHDNAVVYE